ncbi:ABC transporter ATP-binding protein [Propionicimonas sp.]|uniref:ABC transporter ATP-binding protein n=1 Tax=Propionicimonas sp. TaxID=1955623 RepID=UPI0017C45BD1|nr:ABC transporter ATP-binding protein [Propionicimonas sp.]MBU3977911.1 ABC transporter ATP-binding protein [Actinomycetota bacterium]MBA3021866.1 ABC transporter ATP-binding protein [Propionicimonas sp.]MBU3985355.1 ABC transporter ATP-binding protein [Actinomycetota bacterium]MBU4007410.1 ABC transporter ATP-binding protein [Actinomycetota bacterium]MBU4065644.1 ABC transporter ATP-binding protein [Actinomycetota bacterium]
MTIENQVKQRRTQAGQTVLSVSDLHVTFPSEGGLVRAVRGLSFDLAAGETLGIVGESGSGKSVTSLAVMGLHPSTTRISGSIKLHGQELLGQTDSEMSQIRGRDLAMVFQDPLSALTPVYTIGDQIVEAIQAHYDIGKAKAWNRAVELLDLVGIPDPKTRVRSFPFEFSGGMRQRVMIAMAIANDPDVIIADEPTTALDVTIQAQVLEVLKTAQRETGAAVIMITHDLGVVANMSDRVIVMYAGRPVEAGSVDDIFYRPRMPYTIGLLGTVPRLDEANRGALPVLEGNPPTVVDLPAGCPFVPRCPIATEECSSVEPVLTDAGDPNHWVACHHLDEIKAKGLDHSVLFPAPELAERELAEIPRGERPVVLELRDLKRHFPLMKGAIYRRQIGTVYAVDGIDLDLRESETLGLVGESGCGKSTTLLEILNLGRPTTGTITVLGKDTSRLGRAERKKLRRDLQVVFQDPMASLDPRMPVFDIIAEPMSVHGYSKSEIEIRVRELLELVGLEPGHAERYPQHFSGGQRQRIGIARALSLEPKVMVLDEPVSALDVSIQAGVINLLEDLQGKLGLAYLFVAHDLAVIRHIADRVAVMYLGKIVEIGDVDEVYNDPKHPYTQALLSAIPIPDPKTERTRQRIVLSGDLPGPADPPSGCKFRTRCFRYATLGEGDRARCRDEVPQLTVHGADHRAACHFAD